MFFHIFTCFFHLGRYIHVQCMHPYDTVGLVKLPLPLQLFTNYTRTSINEYSISINSIPTYTVILSYCIYSMLYPKANYKYTYTHPVTCTTLKVWMMKQGHTMFHNFILQCQGFEHALLPFFWCYDRLITWIHARQFPHHNLHFHLLSVTWSPENACEISFPFPQHP